MNRNDFYGKISSDEENNGKISKLNEELKLKDDTINKYINQINDLNKKLLDYEKNIKELNLQIKDKIDELNRIKNKIDNDEFKEILPEEKIISILFMSFDYKHYFSFPCKDSTLFVKMEEKFYEEFPEYKETDNYFLVNGNKVKRFKTLKENNIKNGHPVILYKVD